MAGKEVVQLYFAKANSTIDRPIQELKEFGKTDILEPGASQELTFAIPASELSYWDETKSNWSLELGDYEVRAAASSRDTRKRAMITL